MLDHHNNIAISEIKFDDKSKAYGFSKYGLFSVLLLLLSSIAIPITFALHVILLIAALINIKLALRVLFLLIIIKFFHPVFLKYDSNTAAFYWLVFIAASARIILPNFLSAFRNWGILILYVSFLMISSFFVSRYPMISCFKAFVFLLGALSCTVGFSALTDSEKKSFVSWIMTFMSIIIIASIPTLFIPGIGFWINGTGFQGIMQNPQVMGIILSPALAFLSIKLIRHENNKKYVIMPAILSIMAIMVMTGARTSLIAAGLAVFVVLVINFSSRIKIRHRIIIFRAFLLASASLFMLIMALVLNPKLSSSLMSFIYKNRGDNIEESFYRSRGAGLEIHYNNFLKSPIIGNGFGVFATPDPREKITRVMGIPISAATEKGFALVAALEESGAIGILFLFALLFKMSKLAIANNDPGFTGAFFSCLFVNFGEAVFFSPGGIGLYFWILIGICTGMASYKTNTDEINGESK